MKHTRGPWKTDGNGIITGGPDFCTSIASTPVILWMTGAGGTGVKNQRKQISEAQANARLIAAAPDLRAACAVALSCISKTCQDRKPVANNGLGLATPEEQVSIGMLRAAIKAARGE